MHSFFFFFFSSVWFWAWEVKIVQVTWKKIFNIWRPCLCRFFLKSYWVRRWLTTMLSEVPFRSTNLNFNELVQRWNTGITLQLCLKVFQEQLWATEKAYIQFHDVVLCNSPASVVAEGLPVRTSHAARPVGTRLTESKFGSLGLVRRRCTDWLREVFEGWPDTLCFTPGTSRSVKVYSVCLVTSRCWGPSAAAVKVTHSRI